MLDRTRGQQIVEGCRHQAQGIAFHGACAACIDAALEEASTIPLLPPRQPFIPSLDKERRDFVKDIADLAAHLAAVKAAYPEFVG